MSDPDLSIGDVAAACGISVSALRYYDQIGLVPATRRVGGKRRFSPAAIARVQLIRRCQEADFSLEEIASILAAKNAEWRTALDAKLAELRDRRRRLDETIDTLDDLRNCACSAVSDCPAIHNAAARRHRPS